MRGYRQVSFNVAEEQMTRWRKATKFMRQGERAKLLRMTFAHLLSEIEKHRRPRLVEWRLCSRD